MFDNIDKEDGGNETAKTQGNISGDADSQNTGEGLGVKTSPFKPVLPERKKESIIKPDTPVEDIFASQDGNAQNNTANPQGFGLPKSDDGGNVGGGGGFSDHVSTEKPHIPKPQIATDIESGNSKRYFVLGILCIVIIVGGYFGYAKFFAVSPEESGLDDSTNIEGTATDQNNEVMEKENPESSAPSESSGEVSSDTKSDNTASTEEVKNTKPKIVDTDNDGLSDDDEIRFGTDPLNIDSDQDGLTDKEEIIEFGTNPLNPDSDNDTYLDGEEVLNGFNPLGEGRIISY